MSENNRQPRRLSAWERYGRPSNHEAQRRGLRLTSVHPGGLRAPVDLRLNSYGTYNIQQLISNLVKLAFILGMNSPDSPVFDLPSDLFRRITELNNFIYGNITGRYPLDNSNMLHMTRQMPMLALPQPEEPYPEEPPPENDESPPGCNGGKPRRRSKTRRRKR